MRIDWLSVRGDTVGRMHAGDAGGAGDGEAAGETGRMHQGRERLQVTLIGLSAVALIVALWMTSRVMIDTVVHNIESVPGQIRGQEDGPSRTDLNPLKGLFLQAAGDVRSALNRLQYCLLGGSVLILGLLGSGVFQLLRAVNQHVELLKQQKRELDEARRTAERANAVKSTFLANVSHEIRTPLHGILGMSEMALGEELPVEQRQHWATVKECGESLLVLLNDILDSSRIEAGRLELEQVEFDPVRCVRSVVSILEPRATEKGLTVAVDVDNELPTAVRGDPNRLRQIIANLVGNAIKFTESGGVSVSVRRQPGSDRGEEFLFSVSDTGVGIPADKRDCIFEAFQQADTSTARQYGGTGLGLSIASQLVDMMGGQIRVDSEPGRGTTFEFTARFGVVDAASAAVAEAANTQHSFADRRPSGRRVLLADDSPVNRRLASGLLTRRGHEAVVVVDGQEAVDRWAAESFDVILMDLHMPHVDGLHAARMIREREDSGERIPIIAVTAGASRHEEELCSAAGMDGLLSKPFRPDDLYRAVESAVTRHPQSSGV